MNYKQLAGAIIAGIGIGIISIKAGRGVAAGVFLVYVGILLID